MSNKYLYQPFEINVTDMQHWQARPLIYQFFEIVQILEGEGKRVVNEHQYDYDQGRIFLFTPLDCRGFESCTPTRFCSIRFSGILLEQYKTEQERAKVIHWLKQLEVIFTHHNRSQQLLIKNEGDCYLISSLIEHMRNEYHKKDPYHDENLQHFIILVLNVIARNVSPIAVESSNNRVQEPLINKMLVYIQQQIYDPKKLRIKNLASQFNLSEHYVGEYFKKITGDRLQTYLTKYKLGIIEQRLSYSHHSISEIANEFGFSDESHLSRYFRKHTGKTPAQYKKQNHK